MANASMQEEAYAVRLGLKDSFLQPPNEAIDQVSSCPPPTPTEGEIQTIYCSQPDSIELLNSDH